MLTKLFGFALRIAALPLFLAAHAQAQTVEIGNGIFCNTQEQIERFVAHFDGDEMTAVNAVNAEENKSYACVQGTVEFFRGPEIETARNKIGAYHVLKVIIVGILTESGLRSIGPTPSFSVESVDERVA
jgi:hypothetical protein